MSFSTNLHQIQNRILKIRGLHVMLDRDLAEIYGVATKVLNQAVKRNNNRFPDSYLFQLSQNEYIELVTNCDRFSTMKHLSTFPYAFTEQGVAMLSAVLKSDTAVKVSIRIIDAFVEMRQSILMQTGLFSRVELIERRQVEAEYKFEQIFLALENNSLKRAHGIFFDGQIFDAYVFISDIIRSASKTITLIDNYPDDTVLNILSKRKSGVEALLYTKNFTKTFMLDIQKHNSQYPPVEIKLLHNSHDRFLIIDDKELFHMGASLKDLGKKWFAFSKMNWLAELLLQKLKESK